MTHKVKVVHLERIQLELVQEDLSFRGKQRTFQHEVKFTLCLFEDFIQYSHNLADLGAFLMNSTFKL